MSFLVLDDRNSSIQYGPIGNWSYAGSAEEYDGTTTYVYEAGAASLNFTGIRIAVFGTIGSNSSNDSAPQTSYALSDGAGLITDHVTFTGHQAVNIQYRQQFYNSPLLLYGKHSLNITNIRGTLSIDYINITLPDATSSSSVPAASTTATLQTSSTPTGSASAPSTAAIVGSTLGGLAVICLFVFTIVFVRRRHKSGFSTVAPAENPSWIQLHQPLTSPPHPSITPFPLRSGIFQITMSASTVNMHVPQSASDSSENEKGRRAPVLQQSATATSPPLYDCSVPPPRIPNDPPPGYRD